MPEIFFFVLSLGTAVWLLFLAYKDYMSLKKLTLLPDAYKRYLKNDIKIQLTGAISILLLVGYTIF